MTGFEFPWIQYAHEQMNRLFAGTFTWSTSKYGIIHGEPSCSGKDKKVSFEQHVQIWMFDEDLQNEQNCMCQIPLEANYFRVLWDLHGQFGTWDTFDRVGQFLRKNVNFIHAAVGDPRAGQCSESDLVCSSEDHDVKSSDSKPGHELTGKELWESSLLCRLGLLEHQNYGRIAIETWLVSNTVLPLCVDSRRVVLSGELNERDLLRKLRDRWSDLLDDVQVEYRVVPRSHVEDSDATLNLRVILAQRIPLTHKTVLFHYDGFPILRKWRAFSFEDGTFAANVVRTAGIPHLCDRVEVKCLLQFPSQGAVTVAETHDQVFVSQATPIHATAVMIVDDDSRNEDEGSDSDDSDAQSTRVPDESDDEPEQQNVSDDVVSLVGSQIPAMQHENGFTTMNDLLELHGFEQLAGEEDDPDMHDIGVVTQHWNVLQHIFHTLATQNRNDPFLLVTFGLGLVDLGRREALCYGRNFDQIMTRIRDLWADHAQFADLQVVLVQPAPDLGITRPHIVLIVEVMYMQAHDPARGCPVLVHEEGAAEMLAPNVWYAAHVGRRSSALSILSTLHLERGIYPWGVRDAIVRCSGQVLPPGQFRYIDEGALCSIWFGTYPQHVSRASLTVGNVESLFIDLREITESRENDPVQCIFHGISPQNRPLGDRTIWIQPTRFYTGDWYHEARSLWPFSPDIADLLFVHSEASFVNRRNDEQPAALHFIVSYGVEHHQVPVLIRQSISASQDQTFHTERWAVRINPGTHRDNLLADLQHPVFWTKYPERVHIYQVSIHQFPRAGDSYDLFLRVQRTTQVLTFLTDLVSHDDEVEHEQTTLLQIGKKDVSACAFEEICASLLADIDPGDHEWGLEPEANLDLRKPETCILENSLFQHSDVQPIKRVLVEPPNAMWHDQDQLLEQEANTSRKCNASTDIAGLEEVTSKWMDGTWQGINVDLQYIHGLHPFARAAASCTQGNLANVSVFHVYTDGSQKRDTSAWAFVVVAECTHETGERSFFQVGYAGKILCNDIGPWENTPLDAEATAIIAAGEYILNRVIPDHAPVEIHLHFDCTSVGFGADGSQNIARQRGPLSTRQQDARIILSILQRTASLGTHHVHAHEGQPWNEAADSVATWIRKGGRPAQEAELKTFDLCHHPLKQWAWMIAAPSNELPHPTQILSAELCADGLWPCDKALIVPTPTHEKSLQEGGAGLKIGTVNVGTMEYNRCLDGVPCSVKARELMRQFQDAKYDLIALQETRAKHSETRRDGNFVRLISAGDHGHSGVELWLNVAQLEAKFKCVLSCQNDILVWHRDARILAVHLQVDRTGIDVVVAYAPQRGRPDNEIVEWWNHLEAVIQSRKWNAPLWILGDMNCKLGSVLTPAIGGLAADLEDLGGERMRTFLFHLRMNFGTKGRLTPSQVPMEPPVAWITS